MNRIVGILLAAGSAERFGSPKLLHPLADGVPVGVAAARALVEALPHAIAVVRPGDRQLQARLTALGLEVVENPLADSGMGTSLALGVDTAPEAGGWLVALADMPWVQPATIHMLADGLRDGASIVAPAYAGRRGHPVGFSARWRARLQAMRGDAGARGLLAAHPAEVVLRETTDPGVLADVDRHDDIPGPAAV